ncbi:uncharacterized protein LOC111687847 [Lucilia cuprina]|uniref:uncharacterized protein LOC111687847 n=1 Tax=Lucilia cuprina TaxID=7375 RepID=UPI001F061529|nr:uncharacterized protein LOC111687847 [Lucilia cuprina]
MPSLRSTRSRKEESENIEIKENLSSKKERQANKNSTNKTTRAGRAPKETGTILKEINCVKQNSSKSSNSRKTKSKMVHERGNAQTQDKPLENTEGELTKTIGDKEVEQPVIVNEPMDVAENIEDNDDCSPIKKQKMNEKELFEDDNNDDESEEANLSVEQEKNKHHFEKLTETEQNLVKDKAIANTSSKNKSISLKSQTNTLKEPEEAASTGSNLPKQLLTVISNLYLNVGERLHLDFPPRCLDDLAFCHRHHYRSELPDAPAPSQAHSLRSALQHYRYILFINTTTDMCHRGEFPGKGVFTKVMELVLSINYSTKHPNVNIPIFQQAYHKSISLFSMIVRTFPPCWHKLRPYYVGFLECGLDPSKLKNNKEEPPSKSAKIFDILLDLLEEALKNSKEEDLKTSKSETLKYPQNFNTEATSPGCTELSMCSEYWNQNEYEKKEREKQTFDALPSDQKLERIFMALRLLLQILENDLAMWMLHHNKKTKEWIFCAENRPLIVVLCDLTQYTRMTRVARRIFSVYSEAAAKGLCKKRLKVLERFISLLMVASNTADMENTAIGVKYPFLGDQTKTLIEEFFKIFKAHNREKISKYMETIELLRIPYVRYEFIDNVLIMFQFTNTEPLTPQKIALDIAKKRWLKYKPAAELTTLDEDISREQYLHLLLDALRMYCEFHGSKTFLHVITDIKKISPLTTTNDSVHRWPTHGSGVLVLNKMANDIILLETKLKMTVRMSKPKVDLPLADICIDEAIILKYRTDLKFIVSLQNVVLKQKETYTDVDFTAWLEFLNEFAPKKLSKEETN